jgi:hypothetical protein
MATLTPQNEPKVAEYAGGTLSLSARCCQQEVHIATDLRLYHFLILTFAVLVVAHC